MELSLLSNSINDASCFSKSFQCLTNLRSLKLNLSYNEIKDIYCLSTLFENLKKLQDLELCLMKI